MALYKPNSLAANTINKKKWLQVVQGWPQATANAMQNIVAPSVQQSGLPPKNNTVGQTAGQPPVNAGLPVFWTNASQQNATNPSYLDTRNTGLATDYTKLGLKDRQGVYNELNKNQDFLNASDQDKNDTADAIFGKMNIGQQQGIQTDDLPTDNKQYNTIQEAEWDNPRTQNLSDEEKQVYWMLSETEKKLFLNIWRADLKNGLQYLARWKENKNFQSTQNENRKKQEQLQEANADIASSQTLRRAEDQLNKLKANVKYLGTMWAPWVSATKMDAINGQITEAQKVFDELKQTEANADLFRELWYTNLVWQMERQMVLLQDDLDDKVNKSIQSAFSMMSAEEIKGWLDTVEEIDNFRTKLLTNLDNDIGALTDDNIKARQFLVERFDVIAKERKEQMETYQKNANTVNMDMSTAQWYYVDWNWSPIISMATWQPVRMPVKPPMDPVFDKESGKLIMFSTWADGGIVASVQQVTSWSGGGWGKIETIYWTDERGNETKTSVMVMPDGSIRSIWGGDMPNTPTSDSTQPPLSWSNLSSIITANPANITQIAWQMVEWEEYDCGDRAQCGEWRNDSTGRQKPVWDSYDSKKKYIDYSIQQWQPWMWVTFNPWGKFEDNWHIWTIASERYEKDGVMWYDVVSANYHGNETLSKDFVSEWKIAKNGGFIPLEATQNQVQQPTQQNKPQSQWNKQEMMMKAMWLLQGTGWTEWERAKMAQNIVKVAMQNNIPLNEAKKQLWYRTKADDEFVTNSTKTYESLAKASDAVNNAKTLLDLLSAEQTPITDIASIVWFLKSIDPSSVARESETEQVRTARSTFANLWMSVEKMTSGDQLTKKQREQMKNMAEIILKTWEKKYSSTVSDIVKKFDERWLDATSLISTNDINKYAPIQYKIARDKSVTKVETQAPITNAVPSQWQSQSQWQTQAPVQGRLQTQWQPWKGRK